MSNRVLRFDGLRALAVLAVIQHHFGIKVVTDVLQPGGPAVQLFFVLSGYLISGILLDARERVHRGSALTTFYLRRALRIFPAYYVTLTAAALLNAHIYADWPWHAAYLSNVKTALDKHWLGPVSHFWSLAVEEQFYVVWPIIILFARRSWLPRVLWGVVLSAPIWRVLLLNLSGPIAAETSLLSSIDALSIGAWVAYRHRNGHGPVSPLFAYGGSIGVAAWIGANLADTAPAVQIIFGGTATAFLFAWLIDHISRAGRGTAWLEWRPLVAMGSISYGTYLLHNLVPTFTRVISPDAADWMWHPGAGPFVTVAILSNLLAAASWFLIEKPANDLKRYLPYVRDSNSCQRTSTSSSVRLTASRRASAAAMASPPSL